MNKVKGVFLDAASLGQDIDLKTLENLAVDWQCYDFTTPEQVIARCRDAEIIITNKVVLSAYFLNQLDKLKLICVAATGVNNIDLEATKRAGILVANVKDYAGTSIAQMVFSLLLQLTNRVAEYNQLVEQGRWSESKTFCMFDYPIMELAGKTLGIIGYGTLGKSVAPIAKSFGMKVLIAEHKGSAHCRAGRTPFEEVLKESDVLTIHCPLTEQTLNLIDSSEFKLMKNSSIVVNTARGGIVNELALLKALHNREIAAAATDVLTEEPPKPNHLMLEQKPDNLLITPHVAWASIEARNRLFQQLIGNVERYLAGELVQEPI